MKVFLFLCVVMAAGGLEAKNVQLSAAQKEKVNQHIAECVKQSGVKMDVLAEAKKGHFNDDPNLKKFTLCFLEKSGIFHDGKLDIDTALAKAPAGADKGAIKKVLEDCKTKSGKDTADSAFQIFKCYYKGTPTHFVF